MIILKLFYYILLLSMYLEIMCVCCIYMVKISYNNVHIGECISSQLCIQWYHIGILKLAAVRVFPPQKSAMIQIRT